MAGPPASRTGGDAAPDSAYRHRRARRHVQRDAPEPEVGARPDAAASADAAGPPTTPLFPLAAASNPTSHPPRSKSVSAPKLKPDLAVARARAGHERKLEAEPTRARGPPRSPPRRSRIRSPAQDPARPRAQRRPPASPRGRVARRPARAASAVGTAATPRAWGRLFGARQPNARGRASIRQRDRRRRCLPVRDEIATRAQASTSPRPSSAPWMRAGRSGHSARDLGVGSTATAKQPRSPAISRLGPIPSSVATGSQHVALS